MAVTLPIADKITTESDRQTGEKETNNHQRRRLARQKILVAATQTFARRGYFAVSMRDIAKQAGVSLGLTYHYFDSKEHLLRAMIEYTTDAWIQGFLRHMTSRSFFSLREFLVEYLMFMRSFIQKDHPDAFRFYMKHIHQDNMPHLDFLFERVSQIQPYFNQQIQAAFERGEIRNDLDADDVAFMVETISSRIQEAFYSEYLGMDLGLASAGEAEVREKVNDILHLFLGGLAGSENKRKKTAAAAADGEKNINQLNQGRRSR